MRLRTEFLNTQVITSNTGKRLGVVKELLVDVDRREVVALGLRDNILSLSGMPKYMYLNSIDRSGDVILVENEDVIEDVDVDAYSRLVNCEVITEAGEPLGRVRDFQFNLEDGKVSSLIIATIGIPQIPEQIISTYELPIEEVVSSGPDRLIVFENAEERLTQLTVGLLERLGIGRPAWDRDDEEAYYTPTVKSDNYLPAPLRTPVKPPVETKIPVREENWEDEWEQTSAPPPPQRQARHYQEYLEDSREEDNWSTVEGDLPRERSRKTPSQEYDYKYDYDDIETDVWDDDVKSEPYNPPRVNIPEKKKEPEYE